MSPLKKILTINFNIPEPSRKGVVAWVLAIGSVFGGGNFYMNYRSSEKGEIVIAKQDTLNDVTKSRTRKLDSLLIGQARLERKVDFYLDALANHIYESKQQQKEIEANFSALNSAMNANMGVDSIQSLLIATSIRNRN